jgi:LPXTG-site transpeptidase (sortase) family protein
MPLSRHNKHTSKKQTPNSRSIVPKSKRTPRKTTKKKVAAKKTAAKQPRSVKAKSAAKVAKKSKRVIKQTQPVEIASSMQVKVAAPSRFKRWLPKIFLVLIIVGINMVILGGVYLSYRKTILSFQVAPTVTAPVHLRAARPSHIVINRVGVDLNVTPAAIENGIWQTSQTDATHLVDSARPSEGGNVVVYGHNTKKIFAPLHQVKTGDIITLTTEDGRAHEYQIDQITTVTPDQIEVVLPTDHEVLTVYTCTGWLDSKRLIIKAKPRSVSSLI